MPGLTTNHIFRFCTAALLVLLTLVAMPVLASAAGGLQYRMEHMAASGAPVVIEADSASYDRNTGIYTAKGHAKVTQGDKTLEADRVEMNMSTGDARADGSVTLTDPDNVLYAESLSVNFDTGLGVIEGGRLFVSRENYHISGSSLERLSETEFRVVDGSLTTCDGVTPFWRITAGNLDVRTEEDVTARDVTMRIKEVPVLYSPYAWFPLLKPRTTGLLIPGVGYSTDDGFKFFNSFYWAPADNFDATFDIDYRSKRGPGFGAEFRLALARDSRTRLYGFYLDDRKDLRERYNIEFRHTQMLMDRLNMKADINLSDREFYRDLSDSTKERTQRSIDSNLFVTGEIDSGMTYLLTQYTQGLDINSEVIVQRLPEIGFSIYKKRIGDTPLYLDAGGAAAYFNKSRGVTGGRLDVYPKLTAAFNLGGVNIMPRMTYRETAYTLAGKEKKLYDDDRGLFGAGITMQAELSRLHKTGYDFIRAVKHTFEPVVAYNYVKSRGGGSYPKFDGVDTYGRKSAVTYSLTNRFVFRHSADDEEPSFSYLTVILSQMYDHHADLLVTGEARHFSPVYGEVVYKFPFRVTLNNYTRYNVYNNRLLSINTDVRYDDPEGRWYAQVGQRLSKDTDQTFLSPSAFDFFTPSTDFISDFVVTKKEEGGRINFLSAEAGVKVGTAWKFSGKVWYDLTTDSIRESRITTAYESQCWGISVHFTRRPDDRQVMFMLSFKGLGTLKPRFS